MKTKNLTKGLLGVALSAAMIAGQAIPAMAAPLTGTSSTGNVLDYAVTTVVTPTSIKIALNPNVYHITTKYVKTSDASAVSTKTYYTESDGVYTKATLDESGFAANTVYYEAVTSNSQVVSLNYGIANKSTEAKDVTIDIKATYTPTADKEAIVFVDTAEKAQAYDESTNADGAKKDELKMYLAIASAATPSGDAAALTTDTYVKSTAFDASKTYFTKDGTTGAFSKAGTQPTADTFANATYYEETTTIGPEITAGQLADVTMTAATGTSLRKFEAGEEGAAYKAKASIAYKLGEATYSVKAGEILDFDTTQAQLADKLEMSALGGVAGFTITGSINADADWTKADANAIVFTPVYEWEDANGKETAVSGGYNQVTLAAKTVTVTIKNKGDYTGEDTTKVMTVGSDPVAPNTVEGYTFDKYYTDAACSTEFTGKVEATTATLYAKWASVITYSSDGITVSVGGTGNLLFKSAQAFSGSAEVTKVMVNDVEISSDGYSLSDKGTLIIQASAFESASSYTVKAIIDGEGYTATCSAQ